MKNVPVVYTAGPIAGCSWNTAVDWRMYVNNALPECDVRSPMRGKDFLNQMQRIPSGPDKVQAHELAVKAVDAAISSQHAIVVRDHWDVTKADLLVVNLLPSLDVGAPSIGTCFELAWTWMMKKPAVVAMQSDGNPNQHPFVLEAAYIVVPTLPEAVMVSRQLLNLPPEPEV